MGTKLNKKNEKRKNIHRIIAGTRYKKERNSEVFSIGIISLLNKKNNTRAII